MASTNEKDYPPIPESKERPVANEYDERLCESDSDADASSIVYTYYSVDSTNMTMSNLPGPGRLLGNLYSRLGRSLEYRVFRTNAKLHGADPAEVGARIRGMPLWQHQPQAEETSTGSPFRQHVMMLGELNSRDRKLLRRCCRATLYYTSTGAYQIVVSALREIIDLSIKYFPVRDAFNAVRGLDALRILLLLVKQNGSPRVQELRLIEFLVKKAQLCLSDNLVYSACRKSFSLPSWCPELEGIGLRLTLGTFLRHRRLHLIAADLIIFFQLEHKESDPRKISDLIQSFPFWAEYKHKKHSVAIDDLGDDERDLLTRCCNNLLVYFELPLVQIKVAALEVVIELSRRFLAVREAFMKLGAVNSLQGITINPNQLSESGTDKLKNIAAEALFSIQNNEIYDLLKDSTLRKSWTPEVEGAILRLELEHYLFHPKLRTIASEHISFIELSACTFYVFERYARFLLYPNWTDFGPDDRKGLTLGRACFVLAKFATGCKSIKTRIDACKHIENMTFNHPASRSFFLEADLSGRLARAETTMQSPSSVTEVGGTDRLSVLSKRIRSCLQDHEVFPKSIAYFKELNDTLLDIIFDYLRSPELFFIGAKVLSRTWLKVAVLYEDMFYRVVTGLLDMLEDISTHAEAESLVVSVVEKVFFDRRLGRSRYSDKAGKLVNTLCRPPFQELYPIAFRRIQECFE